MNAGQHTPKGIGLCFGHEIFIHVKQLGPEVYLLVEESKQFLIVGMYLSRSFGLFEVT